MGKKKTNKQDLTFEQAIGELKTIVDVIEAGQVPLEESIAQYERGMELIRHCRSILQAAEKRIETLSLESEEVAESEGPAEDTAPPEA